MPNRALFLAVASCFVVTGCPDKAEPPKPTAATVAVAPAAPKPAEAPAAPAASPGQEAKAPTQVAQSSARAMPTTARPGCKKGNCNVTITVEANCVIKADPDPLPVHKDNHDDDIKWTIAGNDYEFTDKGIAWKDPGASGQFHSKAKNGNKWKWTDKNTDTKSWEYSIEVQDKKGGKCKKDPTVMNGAVDSL